MKKNIKRILEKFLNSKGYRLVPKHKSLASFSNDVLNSNFKDLTSSYELLFSEKFGEIPYNENRIEILKELLGTPPSEAYFIIEALARTKPVKGEICEFGVAQGVTSNLIANEIMEDDERKLHLFDSFQGLPKPTDKDTLKDDIFNLGSMAAYEGEMKVPEDHVRTRLRNLGFPDSRCKIHKGFIEDLIISKKQFPELVSFAYIDFDFYEPIKIILEFLDGVTEKGAVIIVDDYDYFSTGVKLAVDEFVKQNRLKYQFYVPDKGFGCFAILTKTQV